MNIPNIVLAIAIAFLFGLFSGAAGWAIYSESQERKAWDSGYADGYKTAGDQARKPLR